MKQMSQLREDYRARFQAARPKLKIKYVDKQYYANKFHFRVVFNKLSAKLINYIKNIDTCRIRRDVNITICTDSIAILDYILLNQDLLNRVAEFNITSEQYLKETELLKGIPIAIKIQRKVEPNRKFEIKFSDFWGSNIKSREEYRNFLKELYKFTKNNKDSLEIPLYSQLIFDQSRYHDGSVLLYANNADIITMLVINNNEKIKKIYKLVEREA